MVGKWVGAGEPNQACAYLICEHFWGHTVESTCTYMQLSATADEGQAYFLHCTKKKGRPGYILL